MREVTDPLLRVTHMEIAQPIGDDSTNRVIVEAIHAGEPRLQHRLEHSGAAMRTHPYPLLLVMIVRRRVRTE
jgi:hypothetical protein